MKKNLLKIITGIIITINTISCTSTQELQENAQAQSIKDTISTKVSSETSTESTVNQGTQGTAWKYWYIDFDSDGYGSNILNENNPKYKKKQPIGYVDRSGDCNDSNKLIIFPLPYFIDADNDSFGSGISTQLCELIPSKGYSTNSNDCNDLDSSINPNALEVWNQLDDNCNTLIDEGLTPPGISIQTTNVLIPEYMGTGGSTDMFIVNDPLNKAFRDKLQAGNFTGLIHSEGHYSEYFHWILGSKKGNGWNPLQPVDPKYCDILQGELCTSYARDFSVSWDTLCKLIQLKQVYTLNIQEGTLQELYHAIDLMSKQSTIVLIYGQEAMSAKYPKLTSKTYPPKFYSWIDSVQLKYPSKVFYHLADIKTVDNPSKLPVWTSDFKAYRVIDSNKVGIRQYSHGFDLYTLTNTVSDTSAYTKAVQSTLPQQLKDINSIFPGCSIFFTQFSTGVPDYAIGSNGNKVKVMGRCLDMFYYLRAEKFWIESNTKGEANILGANIIGLKNLMNVLDFKWLGIINNMYITERYSTLITHTLGTQVDILGGYKDGMYSLIIQNRSGKSIALPEYFLIDNKYTKVNYIKSVGYYSEKLTDTFGQPFDVLQTKVLLPFSITYIELKD